MKKYLITLLLCCITTVAQATILVLGDSLSAGYGLEEGKGWVDLLRGSISRLCVNNHDVINASISGERTENAISKLPGLLSKYHPTMVLIELGANDGLHGSSIETIRKNLIMLIHMVKAQNGQVLLFEMMIPPNLGSQYTSAFKDMYADIANDQDVILVPFLLKDVAGHEDMIQPDGLHPQLDAQQKIFDNVWPTVRDAIHCHD